MRQYERDLEMDSFSRDAKEWTADEEEKLLVLSRRYASGGINDVEWKEITKQLGTGRSQEAVQEYYELAFPAPKAKAKRKKKDPAKKKQASPAKQSKGNKIDAVG